MKDYKDRLSNLRKPSFEALVGNIAHLRYGVVGVPLPGVSVAAEVAGLAAHVHLLPPLDRAAHVEAQLTRVLRLAALAPRVPAARPRTRRHRVLGNLRLGVDLQPEHEAAGAAGAGAGAEVVVLVLLVLPHHHHGVPLLVHLVPLLRVLLVVDPLLLPGRLVLVLDAGQVPGVEVVVYDDLVLGVRRVEARHPLLHLVRLSAVASLGLQI